MSWRVRKMCENCPFRPDDQAIDLAPGRLDGIKECAVIGQPFYCHKTVYTESLRKRPRRQWKECAGALAYRAKVWRDDPGAARRILERIVSEAARS